MNEWIQVFGRFHPLVLHMPIGMLAALAAVEAASVLSRDTSPKPARDVPARLLAVLSAAAAAVSAGTGYVLGLSGDYEGGPVELHRNLGIAVAIASVITAACYFRTGSAWPRRVALTLCMAFLVPAGHFGASMTHGENFLFAPLEPAKTPPSPATLRADGAEDAKLGSIPRDGTTVDSSLPQSHFDAVVAPIFAAHCLNCHGPTKRKGDLALHTAEAISKGGEFGPVLVPGRAQDSELVVRMKLPLEDDDHMPPSGKPQPTEREIAAVEAWIASGASFEASSSPAAIPVVSPSGSPELPKGEPGPKPHESPVVLAPSVLHALRANFIHVAPVAQPSGLLVVDTAAVAANIDDEKVASLLKPLGGALSDLSLARCRITDVSMPVLAEFTALRRLDLRGTAVSSGGVESLRASKSLEVLILSQTKLDDRAVDLLGQMPTLRRVYLWNSGISAPAIARLRNDRPDLFVDAGDRGVTPVVTTEGEVKFSSSAPPVGKEGSQPVQPSLSPVNTVCPVSGSPVVAKYTIVHEGRVIGFCCPNCPKEFWADPAKFEGKLR